MNEKRRILILSDGVKPGGYARVVESIFKYIHAEFEILHFALNYKGAAVRHGWDIIPNDLPGDMLGRVGLPRIITNFKPDLIFICYDFWLYSAYAELLSAYKPRPKVVIYCPADWVPRSHQPYLYLAEADRIVLYTENSRQIMDSVFKTLKKQNQISSLPVTQTLYHGVDTDMFYPLYGFGNFNDLRKSRIEAREKLLPGKKELKNAFIVLNANRNQPRKRIYLTLKAFAEFSKNKRDVFLYLHMGMKDMSVNIPEMSKELGISEKILTTVTSTHKPETSDETLNLIYNACDVGINTASEEGWGLVAFEHAASGAAQIVPGHTACGELWKENGILIPSGNSSSNEYSERLIEENKLVKGLVSELDNLYNDKNCLELQSRKAYNYALSPEFSWKSISQKWLHLLNDILAS